MTIERAIEILNPEHREHYDSIETVNEACRMGMEALERTRWVPVAGNIPPESEVILCSDENTVFAGTLAGNICVAPGSFYGVQPTHWMLLPEPPGME